MKQRMSLIYLLVVFILIGCVQNKFRPNTGFIRLGSNYSKKKGDIYFTQRNYVGPLTSTLHFPELIDVHSRSFKVLDDYYAKDKNNIYYCAKIIENADKETFQNIKLSEFIPYFTELFPNSKGFYSSPEQYIKGKTEYYAKDKKFVYYGETKINKAQPQSFQLITILYSKDSSSVFYKGNFIPNADSESFEVIAGNLAKDNKYIYYSGEIISGSEGFNLSNEHFFLNKNNVYYCSSLLNYHIVAVDTLHKINPMYFEGLGNTFGIDENYVYYKDRIIEGANVITFNVLSSLYSKDSVNVYFEDKVIKDVDPETFKLLCQTWGKDKNWIVRRGEIRKTVDYDSFEVSSGGWAKDKDMQFEKVQLIK